MSHRFSHSSGASGAALPPELAEELAHEPAPVRDELSEIWMLAEPHPAAEPDDATFRRLGAEIWPTLEAALQANAPAPAKVHRLRPALRLVRQHRVRWVAAAACIVVLLGVGLALWQQPVTLEAPRGQVAEFTLPDGSEVTLNSGSTVQYARSFGQRARRVQLVGEGFFTVTENTKPFSVETFNGTVTVLGTAFNVRAWPDEVTPATEVAVFSGKVALGRHDVLENAALLPAGTSARLLAEETVPEPLDATLLDNARAWRDGGFKFVDRPLATAIHEIERRYDVEITVTPEALRLKPVAILIEKSTGPEHILDDICEIHQCQYRAIAGGFEIFQPDAE